MELHAIMELRIDIPRDIGRAATTDREWQFEARSTKCDKHKWIINKKGQHKHQKHPLYFLKYYYYYYY